MSIIAHNAQRTEHNIEFEVAYSGSSSSTSESSSTASCRPSTSGASDADDDTIPTDTTASCTDSEALSLLEKLRAPSKKEKKLRSCLFMLVYDATCTARTLQA